MSESFLRAFGKGLSHGLSEWFRTGQFDIWSLPLRQNESARQHLSICPDVTFGTVHVYIDGPIQVHGSAPLHS